MRKSPFFFPKIDYFCQFLQKSFKKAEKLLKCYVFHIDEQNFILAFLSISAKASKQQKSLD